MVPDVVIRPIRLAFCSVNQSAPSGPAVMSTWASPPPSENRVTAPVVVMRPIWPSAVNHRAPSAPVVIPRSMPGAATGNIVMAPPVVMRPILGGKFAVNHRAPSGPRAMSAGGTLVDGSGKPVTVPAVVIRPIAPVLRLAVEAVNHRAASGPSVIADGNRCAVSGNSVIVAVAAGGARRKVASATESASIARLLRAGPTGRPYAGRRQRCKRVE
jgi:hypothetical protein